MKKKQFRTLYPRLVESSSGQVVNYCGIRCSMEVLGGKWKLLLLSLLFRKAMRFTEFRREIPEISDKMLAENLAELELHDLIERQPTAQNPRQVAYELSDYGRKIQPVLEALYGWGEAHLESHRELLLL